MKKTSTLIPLFLVLIAIYWVFRSSMPSYTQDAVVAEDRFSTDRALAHVKQLSAKPHAVGFEGHAEVRSYILTELQKLGLETTVQEGYTAGDWGNLSKATNILTRIKGTDAGKGKALMLLSHYDSSPHSSLGASDAGSGVATILEGLRAFLHNAKKPKNDIIVLISDAEELGLNGADLFVKEHPWTKDVGLVLNFEARGSGGPSYLLIETNRGNARLIEEFTKADPQFPMANSLVYSLYKMLPNDTDLTVFREDADIEGFNFAFIDDHFDYHTVNDNFDRLDRNTLAHQGSYLMPLLKHFSGADLGDVKSLNDNVYFNVPFYRLVTYPFEWIWPMFGLAIFAFILLMLYGFRKKVLNFKSIAKGVLPMLIALFVNSLIGYFSWPLLKYVYPHYKDILHGFTYNGHAYIAAFVLMAVGLCFYSYAQFKKLNAPNALVAPIFLWLVICGLAATYLQGAGFLIIPVFALLAAFMVYLNQESPSPYLMVFLALPAIAILAPFIKMLPIGLGLKMLVASTLLTTLGFLFILPIFALSNRKKTLAYISLMLFLGFLVYAHSISGFSKDNAKPTSLLYVYDADQGTAQWATYENQVSGWTAQFIGKNRQAPQKLAKKTLGSKYGSGFTFVAEAPKKEIAQMKIEKTNDTIIGKTRMLEICISPQRNVNRLEIFTNEIIIEKASVNGVTLDAHYLKNRKQGKLVTHFISNNEDTELQLSLPKDEVLQLTLFEASNDLLTNGMFSIPARPEDNIPMPFVVNDAILAIKTISFE